jgi:hypothetical protein
MDETTINPTRKRRPGACRPRVVTKPCGWGCGKRLTATEIRAHFTSCRKRPKQ